jgi:putative hydrolase of the HAD superfamily
MIKIISLDMDGTLVKTRFVDKVWMEGIPMLYAERHGLKFHDAKEQVIGEYLKVGSDRLEWYDMDYWIRKFDLKVGKDDVLEMYLEEIEPYPEVKGALEKLSGQYRLVVTSNAAREFIDVELQGFSQYFSEIFSATGDFLHVKKSPLVYQEVCKRMGVKPLEVLHIGDHYTYDYESPIEAGLDALFLDRKGCRTGLEVVGDLREAAEMISGSFSAYPEEQESTYPEWQGQEGIYPEEQEMSCCDHEHDENCCHEHGENCNHRRYEKDEI